jgi:beta-ureidopropionase
MKRQKRIVRVGLIKFVPEKWNLQHNWQMVEKLTRLAVDQGVQLVCTPECILDGYVTDTKTGWSKKRFREISQSLDGDNYLTRARELAKNLGVHLIFGFTEMATGGSYNSAAIIDPCGKLLGYYHKTHLFGTDKRYLAGMTYPVWKTKVGNIGILICMDRWWPETARTLRLKGAELLMIPTYGKRDLQNEWTMRVRSHENQCFLCLADPHTALITDPEGETVAKLQSNLPGTLVYDIDLSEVKSFRIKNRRSDIYKV